MTRDLMTIWQKGSSIIVIYSRSTERNLELYLKQQEQFGENLAPPVITHGLENARSEIQRIKAILRGWNIVVEDLSAEEETV